MKKQPQPNVNLAQTAWDNLLASISDNDLDLLISAGKKMNQGEAILTSPELEACLRWHPQLDVLPRLNSPLFDPN